MRTDDKRPYYKPRTIEPREPTSVLEILIAILGGIGMAILFMAAFAAVAR